MYQIKTEQKILASVEEVWKFISSPQNLKEITPDYMGFDITNSPIPESMYAGMIIAYKVTPVFGIKMKWVTEITHVEEGSYFVDEQRYGPYKMWHHEHHIEKVEGGVVMHDKVSYIPPMGVLGKIANTFFIKQKLKEIFDYRHHAIEKRFNSPS